MLHISEPVNCLWDDAYEYDAPMHSVTCRLQDINHKSLVLSGPHELQALHLTAQDIDRQGKWRTFMPLLASWQLAILHIVNKVEH